jgi:hypothetical protein
MFSKAGAAAVKTRFLVVQFSFTLKRMHSQVHEGQPERQDISKNCKAERPTVSHYLNELPVKMCKFGSQVCPQSPKKGLPQLAPWHHVGATMDITLDKNGSLNRSVRN